MADDTSCSARGTEDSVAALLQELGAPEFGHANGRSLYDHLLGTREILATWKQPQSVCTAGALHSIYGTDVYAAQLVSLEQRPRIRVAAGAEAERLAYLFSSIERSELFAKLVELGQIPADGLECACRGSQGDTTELGALDLEALLIIHMANLAEQACDRGGAPGLWLASVSRLGALLGGRLPTPPVFDGCRHRQSREHENAARSLYAEGITAMWTSDADAERALFEAASLCPWVGEIPALLAYQRLRRGLGAVGPLIEQARTLLGQWGTAWDKRASHAHWLEFVEILDDIQTDTDELGPLPAPNPENLSAFIEQLKQRTFVRIYLSEPEPEPEPVELAPRLQRYFASFANNHGQPHMKVYPGLPAPAWFHSDDLPIVEALQREYELVKAEIEGLEVPFVRESEDIARSGDWGVIFFYERGRRNEATCARCPTIARIIDEHQTVRSLSGLIYVSRLRAGTHVAPHCGPTNLRARCHLGIRVPAGNCGLRVDGRTRRWEEGKCLVFNDFLLHEAWNHTSEDRILLILDVWHPALSAGEVEVLEGLHRYVAGQRESLESYWRGNDEARRDEEIATHVRVQEH